MPLEKEILESLIFATGLLTMAERAPEGFLEPSKELYDLVVKHLYCIMHYHGTDKSYLDGKTAVLKRLPELELAFKGLQSDLIAKSLS